MSLESPAGLQETPLQRYEVAHREVMQSLDEDDFEGAVMRVLKYLYPSRENFRLASSGAEDIPESELDETEDRLLQGYIRQSRALVKAGDKERIKRWIGAMRPIEPVVVSKRPPLESVPAGPPRDLELAGLSVDECRKVLIERWIVSNEAIPSEVKPWVLELIGHFKDVFADPSIKEVEVRYKTKDQDKDGESVTIRYRTARAQANKTLRQSHLKWFDPK